MTSTLMFFNNFRKRGIFFIFFFILLINGNYAALAEKNIKPDRDFFTKSYFVENKGQMLQTDQKQAQQVLYYIRFGEMQICFLKDRISYVFQHVEKPLSKISEATGEPEIIDPNTVDQLRKVTSIRTDIVFQHIQNQVEISGEEADGTYSNFYLPQCPQGLQYVRHFKSVRYKNIYPFTDLVFYLKEGKLKYDFLVKCGGDPGNIELKVEGNTSLLGNTEGGLKIGNLMGHISEKAPYSYVNREGQVIPVPSAFKINKNSIFYSVKEPSLNETLTIDPELYWSTFLGGSGNAEVVNAVTTDPSNNIYAVGNTNSINFPVTAGALYTVFAGVVDGFIAKFDDFGVMKWCTYMGSSASDLIHDILYTPALNGAPGILAVGASYGANFPLQNLAGAYNQAFGGGTDDAVITGLTPNGTMVWSTYYGGNNIDGGNSITRDPVTNAIYITGITSSSNLPILDQGGGAYYQTTCITYDAFIVKFDASMNRKWATFYGFEAGEGAFTIISDSKGNIYISFYVSSGLLTAPGVPRSGNPTCYYQTAFGGGSYDMGLAMFDPNGARIWATLYGGGALDMYGRLQVDKWDNLYLVLCTASNNIPVKNYAGGYNQAYGGGTCDGFIAMFDNMSNLVWATYYGGLGDEITTFGGSFSYYRNMGMDNDGNIYITSSTSSSNFPLGGSSCENFSQTTLGGGGNDAFILEFNKDHVLEWATFFGGNGDEQGFALCVDKDNNVIVGGNTTNTVGFPLKNPAGGAYYDASYNGGNQDAFLTKFAAYYSHTHALMADGSLKGWGDDGEGQIGTGAFSAYSTIPVSASAFPSPVISVSEGKEFTVALLANGTVYSWGKNTCGQLGNGTFTNSNTPAPVTAAWGSVKAIAVSAGDYHTLVLLDDGSVWSWGRNDYGQLGNGTLINSNTPVNVSGAASVKAISAGGFHSLALLSTGQVLSWGLNFYGQVGDGTTILRTAPVSVLTGGSALTNIVAIAAGGYHSLALTANGFVKAWGRNDFGQLGDLTNIDRYNPVTVFNAGGQFYPV